MKILKWLYLGAAVFFVFAAVFIFKNPVANIAALGTFFAVSMLIYGISDILAYFKTTPVRRQQWGIINGILTMIIAIWLLSGRVVNLSVAIPIAFAFWVLMTSLMRFITGRQFKDTWGTIWGGIGFVLGVIMLFYPFFSAVIISYTIAVMFLYQGIACVIAFLKFYKK